MKECARGWRCSCAPGFQRFMVGFGLFERKSTKEVTIDT
jgi:hypothetical protein